MKFQRRGVDMDQDQAAEHPDVTHMKHLYRDAHQRAENLQRQVCALHGGIEAVLALMGRDPSEDERMRAVYTLLEHTLEAGRAAAG